MTLDAIVWKVNEDQYDDREIITVNLVESYGKLMEFAKKYLPDKFFFGSRSKKEPKKYYSAGDAGKYINSSGNDKFFSGEICD